MKKFLSILLSAMMTLSVFTAGGATVTAYETDTAESQAQTEQISSGDSVYGDFKYTVSDNNEVTITKYTEYYTTEVVIPSSIEGKPVTSIGEFAFESAGNLTSVTIPNSVTSIGKYAFLDCWLLKSITIPNSVTSIGFRAFGWYYRALEYSELPDIDMMLYFTIYGYKGSAAEEYANYHRFDFVDIYIDMFNYTISDNQVTITGLKDKTVTEVVIPSTIDGMPVTGIDGAAFINCTKLINVTIPDSVTSIGIDTFTNCTSLKNVTIPNSVTNIGNHAFDHCTSLTNVIMPNSVTSIGYGAFGSCHSLTSVTIPDSITSIEVSTFRNCTNLTSVTIPESVTSIGDSAFDGCHSLTSVTILNSVTSIGNKAFGYNNSQEKIDGFRIYGYKFSAAEKYANENDFEFVDLEKEVQSVTLNKTTITIGVGQSYTLVPTTDPEDAETTFTWKSSKKDIATVTSKGKVTGKAVGRATITVKTANGKTATCKVEVKPAPESVAISKTSIKIGVKQKYTLTTMLTPSNAATYCSWSSDNTAVATVSSGGAVTGKKAGTATITVKTTNGKTATCKVTVKKAPIAIALDKTELSLSVDEKYTLTKLVPENSAAEYTWSSSDADVAEVSSDGKVTAKKAGTTTITLTSHNGKTATCTVTVK